MIERNDGMRNRIETIAFMISQGVDPTEAGKVYQEKREPIQLESARSPEVQARIDIIIGLVHSGVDPQSAVRVVSEYPDMIQMIVAANSSQPDSG